nr:hypothetical protein GCM10017745_52690 [Saccharothrix mutabilis subsp. capreolus]
MNANGSCTHGLTSEYPSRAAPIMPAQEKAKVSRRNTRTPRVRVAVIVMRVSQPRHRPVDHYHWTASRGYGQAYPGTTREPTDSAPRLD